MSIRRTIAFTAPLLLVLSACDDEPDVAVENDDREASGEVLEGTISDAMLPLDEVRSQAPLAAPEETAAPDGPAAATPAAEPVEEPSQTTEPAVDTAADAG